MGQNADLQAGIVKAIQSVDSKLDQILELLMEQATRPKLLKSTKSKTD